MDKNKKAELESRLRILFEQSDFYENELMSKNSEMSKRIEAFDETNAHLSEGIKTVKDKIKEINNEIRVTSKKLFGSKQTTLVD